MSTVKLEIYKKHIAIITLDRANAANAMSINLLHELRASFQEVENNPELRCVILSAEGEKAFCAGADLKERADMNEREVLQTVQLIRTTVNEVEQLAVPVIAAINGAAFGGGLELALACDLRIASDNAKMGLTETSLGIIPGAGGTQRLSRIVGLGKAKEMIFAARRITAKEALAIGLVEQVVAQTDLLSASKELAAQIAKNGPIALKQAKKAIQEGFGVDLHTGLEIEKMCYQVTIPTEDRLEGLKAFKEKRPPIYKGK